MPNVTENTLQTSLVIRKANTAVHSGRNRSLFNRRNPRRADGSQSSQNANAEQTKMMRVRTKVRANANQSVLPSRRPLWNSALHTALQLTDRKKSCLITLEANPLMMRLKLQPSATTRNFTLRIYLMKDTALLLSQWL